MTKEYYLKQEHSQGMFHLKQSNLVPLSAFFNLKLMDQQLTTVEEMAMFKKRQFHAPKTWRKKCPKEQQQAGDSTSAIVEYISDCLNDSWLKDHLRAEEWSGANLKWFSITQLF